MDVIIIFHFCTNGCNIFDLVVHGFAKSSMCFAFSIAGGDYLATVIVVVEFFFYIIPQPSDLSIVAGDNTLSILDRH